MTLGGTPQVLKWERVSQIEVATGSVVGGGPMDPVLAAGVASKSDPRAALADSILPALQRSPCLISFSGGRDSSAVLATAVGLARRLGLAEPVAVTRRWPKFPGTDESVWQEKVVRHLGLSNWERVDFEEMDIVGPTCAPSLLARGPLWPPLIHTWPPIFELARGGALLTGEGGDELFDPARGTVLSLLSADPKRISNPKVVKETLAALAPRPWRHRQARSSLRSLVPLWLAPTEAVPYLNRLASWVADEPLCWLRGVARSIGDRSHRLGHHNLSVMASEYDLLLKHPLLDPAFVLACAQRAGRFGFTGRTAAMRALFSSELPESVITRKDKIYTNRVMLSMATRIFADEWSGSGLDPHLVNVDLLRAAWRREEVPVTSILALQTAWYSDHIRSDER